MWPFYGRLLVFLLLTSFLVYGLFFVALYPMHDEGSLLHYLAWMVDKHGVVPYRDVFETAFPGSFLFHMGIGRLLGYDDTAFRILDVGWLLILMWVTWRIMRRIEPTIAWITALGFGSLYFKAGAGMTLQRDYVGILPVALALLVVLQQNWPVWSRAFLAGLCFGLAASMKPHLVLGLPVILWLLMGDRGRSSRAVIIRRSFRIVMASGAGFLAGFGMPLLWVWYRGAMPAFLDMLVHYMPLYLDLDGFVDTHHGWQTWLTGYAFVLLLFTFHWLVLSGLAIWQGLATLPERSEARRLLVAWMLLVLIYALYPFPANKFYEYHWMPFRYFGLLLAGFLLLPVFRHSGASCVRRVLCGLAYTILVWQVAYPPPVEMAQNLWGWTTEGYKTQQVLGDRIGGYLQKHARPGDRVQPLDTGGAALRGMLQSETIMATPYSTFQDLLHNYDTPVIVAMRTRFMKELTDDPPRYIINTYTTPEMPCADGKPCELRELDQFVAQHYAVVMELCMPDRCHVRIFERAAH